MKLGALLWLTVLPCACTVAFDLSELGEGCTSQQKLCADGSCAELDDPRTGCAEDSCHACSAANGLAECSANGRCVVLPGNCFWPYADCDGDQLDCEANTATSLEHCGACNHPACAGVTLPHAAPACANGGCGIRRCDPGFADCDGLTHSGCESHLAGDSDNCGQCGHTCEPDQSCAQGVCTP